MNVDSGDATRGVSPNKTRIAAVLARMSLHGMNGINAGGVLSAWWLVRGRRICFEQRPEEAVTYSYIITLWWGRRTFGCDEKRNEVWLESLGQLSVYCSSAVCRSYMELDERSMRCLHEAKWTSPGSETPLSRGNVDDIFLSGRGMQNTESSQGLSAGRCYSVFAPDSPLL